MVAYASAVMRARAVPREIKLAAGALKQIFRIERSCLALRHGHTIHEAHLSQREAAIHLGRGIIL
jgi:hypothetical protein